MSNITKRMSLIRNIMFPGIHLIQKRLLLNCCIVHCALLHTQTATHHGCNEFAHCCMPRPQNIMVHIASMANTRMSLSHSRRLQCYLKTRYIHGALRSGYATMRNEQCNNSEDNLYWIRYIRKGQLAGVFLKFKQPQCLFYAFLSFLALHFTNRCVPVDQRSYAIALQWDLIRLLGTIPGPILFGHLIDKTCVLWDNR